MGGQDKCLLPFGDTTLIDVAIERARPQVDCLLLSVNGDHRRLADRGVPQAADVAGDHAGPLAGILTAMAWCEHHCPDAEWVLSMACDTPFFPRDLASRLLEAALAEAEKKIVVLRADTHAEHGEVVKLMDLIRESGAEGLTVDARTAPVASD